MKKRVSELEGAELDYAVAVALGEKGVRIGTNNITRERVCLHEMECGIVGVNEVWFCPSTKWQDGGPIIERERIDVTYAYDCWCGMVWDNETIEPKIDQFGTTPLIAAMRCFVTSKLGEEVELP